MNFPANPSHFHTHQAPATSKSGLPHHPAPCSETPPPATHIPQAVTTPLADTFEPNAAAHRQASIQVSTETSASLPLVKPVQSATPGSGSGNAPANFGNPFFRPIIQSGIRPQAQTARQHTRTTLPHHAAQSLTQRLLDTLQSHSALLPTIPEEMHAQPKPINSRREETTAQPKTRSPQPMQATAPQTKSPKHHQQSRAIKRRQASANPPDPTTMAQPGEKPTPSTTRRRPRNTWHTRQQHPRKATHPQQAPWA